MSGELSRNPRRVARVDVLGRVGTAVPDGHWFALTLDDGERYLVALPRGASTGIRLVRLAPTLPAADREAPVASRVSS